MAVKVFTRSQIGLRPVDRDAYDYAKVTFASIHHGGDVGPPPMRFASAAATVRSWQAYHQGKGWDDLGYNLLIDGMGRVYQGRPVGAVPAAVGGHNTGSVAICFIQDGRRYKLNWMQRRTLKKLFEKGLPQIGLPPLKNLTVKVHNEFDGHESNECPGQHIKRHVRWRRSEY